jgi:hypothetical protein
MMKTAIIIQIELFGQRIQLPVSAQWSQRLYVKVQGKMMHNDMHKIVFQSN